jgi:hypothetical protein
MVSSIDSQYELPPRNNRAKPPKRYVLKDGTSSEYLIDNYVSTKYLQEPVRNFNDQLN